MFWCPTAVFGRLGDGWVGQNWENDGQSYVARITWYSRLRSEAPPKPEEVPYAGKSSPTNGQGHRIERRYIGMAPTASRTSRAIAGVALTLTLAACSTTSYEKEIALESHWQCDVQHRTYSDVGELEADLSTRLASEGISAERYIEFKAAMETSPDLRSETLAAYEAYCGVASDD